MEAIAFRVELPVRVDRTRPEAGLHAARHDGADANVVVAQVEHHRLGEAGQAELGGVVGGPAGERVFPRKASDVQDEPAAPLPHAGGGQSREVERAAQVRGDDLVPGLRSQFVDRTEVAHAGVVHQNVHAAQLPVDEREELSGLLGASDIAGFADGGAGRIQLPQGRVQRDAVPSAYGHADAFVRQSLRDGPANAPGSARNDCDLAAEINHSCAILFSNEVVPPAFDKIAGRQRASLQRGFSCLFKTGSTRSVRTTQPESAKRSGAWPAPVSTGHGGTPRRRPTKSWNPSPARSAASAAPATLRRCSQPWWTRRLSSAVARFCCCVAAAP